jgi:excinuclease ABC subunit B
VAILDADKEGFLRSVRSLIQTFGRASRNASGRVVMYADKITDSMRQAMAETSRRRARQQAYNSEHGIIPRTVHKDMDNVLDAIYSRGKAEKAPRPRGASFIDDIMERAQDAGTLEKLIKALEKDMRAAAKDMAFERAAELRDAITALRVKHGGEGAS